MPQQFSRPWRLSRVAAVCSIFLVVFLANRLALPAPVAAAAAPIFSVNSTGDVHGAAPLTDGICATAYANGTPNGTCTLRAAIEEANNVAGGGATIDFAGVSGPATYTLQYGQLQITASMTIVGADPTATVIDGNGSATKTRVLYLPVDGRAVNVSGLTIENGLDQYTSMSANAIGGGILSYSDLTLTNVVISGNTAAASSGAAYGGGIYEQGALTILNSTVSGNHATVVSSSGGVASGGGIMSSEAISLTNSSITGNYARDQGGGIRGEATLVSSTVSDNVGGLGGGIFALGLVAIDSTISGNIATRDGGGIYDYLGTANLYNVTVAGNTAEGSPSGLGFGGGVYVAHGTTLNFQNSIIARNLHAYRVNGNAFIGDEDCSGTVTSNGSNIVGVTDDCTINGPVNVTNPMIGPLQNNGGPTATRALMSGSPAIDRGQSSNCTDNLGQAITRDQRGATRPIDGDGNGSAVCDLGASEYNSVPRYQDSDLHVQYNGWRAVSNPTASGGSYEISAVKSDKATFKFSGSAVSWVTRKGPEMGKAQVLIDGANKGTFNLFAPNTTPFTQVFAGMANRQHSIVINVLHQTSAAGFNVAVDAFVVGGTTVQDGACQITYDTWKCVATPSASGGAWRISATAGATASLSFVGPGINWQAATGAKYGKASVCVDSSCSTSNLASGSATRSFSGLPNAAHVIRITVLHTKDPAATGYSVVVDAFFGPIRIA